jgi:mono/diheme cytochrome c family protein
MTPRAVSFLGSVALLLLVGPAVAGDVEHGRRVAQQTCAACHIVGRGTRGMVADSPPFEIIGIKYGFSEDRLISALVAPHAKMNFSLRGREAVDVAAYIATLAR